MQIKNTTRSQRAQEYLARALDISDKLQKNEGNSKPSDFIRFDDVYDANVAYDGWVRQFNPIAQGSNPAMSAINKEIEIETQKVLDDYFNGKISDAELKENFISLAKKNFAANEENGNGIVLILNNADKAMIETFYSEFRRNILSKAVSQNNFEGSRHITGEMNSQREWKYYNSDYYFKSEAAIAAITVGAEELTTEREHEEAFEVPDYANKELWAYNNFNSALSNPFAVNEKLFLDPNQVPPNGLKWFYESGGSTTTVNSLSLYEIVDADGTTIWKRDDKSKEFDATDPTTATMWATITDKKGITHQIGSTLNFKYQDSDLCVVGQRMQFSQGNVSENLLANSFLNNMQVYPKSFFTNQPRQTVNYRV